MTEGEILARLDRTIERNSRVIEENMRAAAEHSRVVEMNSRVIDDLRTFLRDITTRQERVLNAVIAEMTDLRAESRAQREALLRVIDRFPPPGGQPAT